jgi:hypothetical protein
MRSGFALGVPTTTIELDKPRVLGFTMGSMKRAQDLGVLNVNAEDPTAMMLALPEFVWACLDEEGREELSVEAIRELMSPHNMLSIAEKMSNLFKASVPEGNASPAAALERLTETTAGMNRSTSSSSTRSAATT